MSDPAHRRVRYENRVVRIADLTVTEDVVVDADFENCQVVGPAVVIFMDCVLENGTFVGDPDAMLWPLAPGKVQILGAVGFRGCTFRRCKFERIGVAGTDEALAPLRAMPRKP